MLILEKKEIVFVWVGKYENKDEKMKDEKVEVKIKDEKKER